jgi:membrane-associated phospholipid phosphatase
VTTGSRSRVKPPVVGAAARWVAFGVAWGLAWGIEREARAEDRAPTPLDDVGSDIADALGGWNLVLYGAAVGETAAMAFAGGDHGARVLVRENLASDAWGNTAYVSGYVLPVLVAPAIWIAGLAAHDRATVGAGSAAVQALALAAVATAVLKWSTGRPYPLHGGDPHAPDVLEHPAYAREFSPFNLKGDWAWPSGHTSTTISVVAALAEWDPSCVAIPVIGYSVSAAIGLGMIVGDHHWTSDVVAGGLIGYAVGSSVGRSFHRRATGEAHGSRDAHYAHGMHDIRVMPMGAGTLGATLSAVF